jgi:hypothetical protein
LTVASVDCARDRVDRVDDCRGGDETGMGKLDREISPGLGGTDR